MSQSTPSTVAPPVRRFVALLTALLLVVGWQVGLPATARADGPTTFSNTTAIAIPATGSPNQIGPASPYPSNITVSGMTGLVSKVTVTFHNLTHGVLSDVDALLVAPSGENLIVLSDAGPQNTLTFTNNATLTFDDSAATTIPGGNVPSGSYQVTNNPWQQADTFPAPAPSPSGEVTLAGAFSGIDPNGQWRLFIVDDTSGDTGTMAGGWSMAITTEAAAVATTTTVTSSDTTSTTGDPVTFTASVRAGGSAVTVGTVQFSRDGTNLGAPVPLNGSGNATLTTSSLAEGTHLIRASFSGATGYLTSNGTLSQRVDNVTVVTDTTFCNTGTITTPERGAATPYPSNIFVTGLTGQVTKVTAQLKGLSHTAPIDYDILLSGPTPTKNVFLMSDSGGQNPVSNVNLTFDDDAASTIGNSLASGTYKPTRTADTSVENMPAPAPPLSDATTLSTFNGASGNGTWSLWVVDDATGDTGSISGGWCVTITSAAPTTTSLTASPNPSTVGEGVAFTARVTSGGNPVSAGTVQFSDGATALGAPVAVAADGTALLTTSSLTAGSHTITAAYSGTATLGESSDTVDQVVAKVATITTLTAAPNPSDVGAPVQFTATVTAAGGSVPDGSVTFSIDGTDQPPISLDAAGMATLSTSSLAAGTHAVEARYTGTARYAASSDDVSQVVSRKLSATALTSSLNPSQVGDEVTFTATVTVGEALVSAGTVTFSIDGTDAATVAVSAAGVATLTSSALTAGTHAIEARYNETDAIASSRASINQVVGRHASATDLTSSLNPSQVGDTVTFTATVTSGGAPVTSGSVTFNVDGTDAATVAVSAAGVATYTTSALGAGTHPVEARYVETAAVAASSDAVDQVVGQQASTTTVTSSPNPAAFGATVTFTATVTAGGTPVTGGTVQFSVGSTPVGLPVTVAADGTATLTQAGGLEPGTFTMTATYSGTADIAGSSGSVDQVVQARPTTTALTGPTLTEVGVDATYTATVTTAGGPVTSGSVVFAVDGVPVTGEVGVDGSGQATFTTSTLVYGSPTITATYTDTAGGHQSSTGSLNVSVWMRIGSGGPYQVAEGESLTLAGTGSPGGTFGWDLNGDGDYSDATGLTPTLTWAQLEALGINDGPSSHTIRLQISSGSTLVAAATQLTVTNTAPDSVLTGDLTATVGQPFTIKVGADDPSSADMAAMFTYTVDWGDGTPVETVTGPADPPVTHTYTQAGDYDAEFTATDKDGGTGPGTTVQVTAEPAASPSPSPSPTDDSDDNGNSDGNNDDLPQTGADADPDLLLMGMGLVAVGALVTVGGLIGRSHRRRG